MQIEKIKLGNLKSILDNMDKLTEVSLPIKISYNISKLVANLVSEYNIFEENRMKLIQRYAKKDDKGEVITDSNNVVEIENNNIKDFNNEINELLNIEIDIKFKKISVSELSKSNVNIPPKVLCGLDMFFKE